MTDQPIEGGALPPAIYQPTPEPERVDREAEFYGASRGLALREIFEDATIGDRLFGFLEADAARARGAQRNRVFGTDAPLSAEEANDRYGVPGRLSFDAPISAPMGAWRQGLAQREAFRDQVVANADVGPLEAIGASIAGSVLDPVGLPLWLVPELATGRALRSGVAASRLGRLGVIERGVLTGAAEGAAGSVLYEGANLWLHHEAADDYDFGDASANVLFGTLLGGLAGGAGGWWEGRSQARPPRVIETMGEDAQAGLRAVAMDAMIEDRPVDLGPMLARQAEVEARRPSPGADADVETLAPLRARWLNQDVAVTPRGAEVPVRYAVVDAEDLVTSHDDDLARNPVYPAELQPRQRDRAGAQARNRALEAELNPRRLLREVGAETGAPIVSPDGVVESGNGRTIALRRSYRTGSGAGARYRAELEAQGFDVSGMERPMLVRVRTSSLAAEDRVRLTRDMNAEATEAYSPSERATADAASMDDGLLAMIDGADLNSAGNRRFVRAFLERVAPDDLNRMTTGDGRLSEAGLDRINAAMVARAYGDRELVEALFEATDSNIRSLGRALAEAAPEWAAMRAAVARGEAPAALDPTDALKAAVSFIRTVRARRGSIEEAMELTIGQYDAFSGAAMTPETEAMIRSFFRTSKEGATLWKSPRSAASLADGLRWLAGEVRKAQPGPDLFGDAADASTGRQLLDAFGRWLGRAGDDGEPVPGLFGPPDADGRPVRQTGDTDGRVVGRPDAGGNTEKPRLAKGETPPPPKGDPYADPEVAALAADTEAMLAREGVDAPDGADPQTVADAVAAGAFCLKAGG